MKALKIFFACCVILLFAVPALALTVIGTDTYPDDVVAVQAAIDAANPGDTIYLKNTFNFGVNEAAPYIDGSDPKYTCFNPLGGFFDPNPAFWNGDLPGSIFITKDLNIIGDSAVIQGGYRAFTVGMTSPETHTDIGNGYEHHWYYDIDLDGGPFLAPAGSTLVPVNVTIKGIEFENPLFAAIWIAASKDTGMTEIMENTFNDGMTLAWGMWDPDYRLARAVHVEMPGYFIRILPDSTIKGKIVISHNRADGKARPDPDRVTTGLSHFIYAWYIKADLEVTKNDINDMGFLAVSLGGLWQKNDIIGNTISLEEGCTGGFGISEQGYGILLGGQDEGNAETSRTSIKDNHIIAPGADGISFLTKNKYVQLSNNEIEAGYAGIVQYEMGPAFLNYLADSTIKANIIRGEGFYGILVGGISNHNEFLGNNLATLNVPKPPDGATYYFGPNTAYNTVKGFTGDKYVDDQGTNNNITGVN